MPRNYKLYLNDIIKSIEHIEEYTKKATVDDFMSNQMMQDAVIRNLEIIGEAVKNLPGSITESNEFFWGKYVRMRDLVAHTYFGVNYNIIWGLVKTGLSDLKSEVRKLL